jgi:DNA-binding transcriptional regulator LsrR (DeoR family)
MLLRHYLDEGLTQVQIAKRLQMNERTIRRWIRAGGRREATILRRRLSKPRFLNPF